MLSFPTQSGSGHIGASLPVGALGGHPVVGVPPAPACLSMFAFATGMIGLEAGSVPPPVSVNHHTATAPTPAPTANLELIRAPPAFSVLMSSAMSLALSSGLDERALSADLMTPSDFRTLSMKSDRPQEARSRPFSPAAQPAEVRAELASSLNADSSSGVMMMSTSPFSFVGAATGAVCVMVAVELPSIFVTVAVMCCVSPCFH